MTRQITIVFSQTNDGPVSASFLAEPGGELERAARRGLAASGVVASEQTGRKE